LFPRSCNLLSRKYGQRLRHRIHTPDQRPRPFTTAAWQLQRRLVVVDEDSDVMLNCEPLNAAATELTPWQAQTVHW